MADPIRRVFLSHSSEQRELADRLYRLCEDNGVHVWYSHSDVVQRFDEEIPEAIRACFIFIAIVTPAYQDSPECQIEWKQARQKIGVPIVLDSRPSSGTAQWLEKTVVLNSQWLDINAPDFETKFLNRLAHLLGISRVPGPERSLVSGPPQVPPVPLFARYPRAREWGRVVSVRSFYGKPTAMTVTDRAVVLQPLVADGSAAELYRGTAVTGAALSADGRYLCVVDQSIPRWVTLSPLGLPDTRWVTANDGGYSDVLAVAGCRRPEVGVSAVLAGELLSRVTIDEFGGITSGTSYRPARAAAMDAAGNVVVVQADGHPIGPLALELPPQVDGVDVVGDGSMLAALVDDDLVVVRRPDGRWTGRPPWPVDRVAFIRGPQAGSTGPRLALIGKGEIGILDLAAVPITEAAGPPAQAG